YVSELDGQSGQFRYVEEIIKDINYLHIPGISIDDMDNLYLTGWFRGAATFGDTTIVAPQINKEDLFVSKFSPNLEGMDHVWTIHSSGPGSELATNIVTVSSDEHYISGAFNGGNVVLGSLMLPVSSS